MAHPSPPDICTVRTRRPPRKRALLIGVTGSESEDTSALRSSQDVRLIRQLLIDCYKYDAHDIITLVEDHGTSKGLRPTKRNIIRHMNALVKRAKSGDQFFIFYAGHGMQSRCHSETETDGEDEFMMCEDGRFIKDNRLRRILVDKLPPGAQLVAIFDTCHAGTMLDLPHTICNSVSARPFALVFVTRLRCVVVFVRMRTSGRRPAKNSKTPTEGANKRNHGHRAHCTGSCGVSSQPQAHVVSISSTADDEESWEDAKGGPLSQAFEQIVRNNPHLSYRELMISLRDQLDKTCLKRRIEVDQWLEENQSLASPQDMDDCEQAKRSQHAQLSSLQRLDLDKPFML